MDFAESGEHRALRAAVAEIARDSGRAATPSAPRSGGLMPYWGLARLTRIAPVNREMILNFVAQHSLGLPRSY